MTDQPTKERTKLDFALAVRQHWARSLYPALVDEARHQVEQATDPQDAVAAVHEAQVYPWFAWMERASQKQLWRAVEDAVATDASGPAAEIAPAGGELELDRELKLPAWYTDVDIHVQPGGVWSSDTAAKVYELGAKLVMLGENDDFLFHQLFADTAVPDRAYRRIVDLGCGFGKSTRPFKLRWPGADVIGVDLSAPVLRLAHQLAESAGLAIRFHQRDARRTRLESESVDLVSGTMLLHELPAQVTRDVMVEVNRILAPGGLVRILDFQPTGDPIRDLAMIEHGRRNNEPYMPVVLGTDFAQVCGQAGLIDVQWVAFDERGAGRLETASWPERSEWHFPWAVLEARKPERTDD